MFSPFDMGRQIVYEARCFLMTRPLRGTWLYVSIKGFKDTSPKKRLLSCAVTLDKMDN